MFLIAAVAVMGLAVAGVAPALAGGQGGGGNAPTPGANAYFGQGQQPLLGVWTRAGGRLQQMDTTYSGRPVAPQPG
jgi:hypothetical protein